MAEPFAKPTEQDLKKARELYSDPLIYYMTNVVIKNLNATPFESWNYAESHKKETIRLMRTTLYWLGWDTFQELLGEAIAQASDEFYINFELPPMNYYFSRDKGKFSLTSDADILTIAEKYGTEITKNNRAVCPFHNDTDPSLQFYPKTNSFYCFGCQTGGDVITFVQKMEELKNE